MRTLGMFGKKGGASIPPPPSEAQAKEKLAIYVYEYLMHSGAEKSAATFLDEMRWDKTIRINEPPGFLQAWWNIFWDVYSAAPERREHCEHSPEAKAFHDLGMVNSGCPLVNGIDGANATSSPHGMTSHQGPPHCADGIPPGGGGPVHLHPAFLSGGPPHYMPSSRYPGPPGSSPRPGMRLPPVMSPQPAMRLQPMYPCDDPIAGIRNMMPFQRLPAGIAGNGGCSPFGPVPGGIPSRLQLSHNNSVTSLSNGFHPAGPGTPIMSSPQSAPDGSLNEPPRFMMRTPPVGSSLAGCLMPSDHGGPGPVTAMAEMLMNGEGNPFCQEVNKSPMSAKGVPGSAGTPGPSSVGPHPNIDPGSVSAAGTQFMPQYMLGDRGSAADTEAIMKIKASLGEDLRNFEKPDDGDGGPTSTGNMGGVSAYSFGP